MTTKYTRYLTIVGLLALVVPVAAAGPPFQSTVPGDVLTQYRNLRIDWTTNIWIYANRMFGMLAVIEFAWSAIVLALDKTDLQSWIAGLIRKLMWIGAFYALLINGRIWIPAIIDSFEIIGSNAAGMSSPLSPGDVFAQGIGIAAALMDGGSTSAFFTNPASSLALVFAALIIMVSYTIITINFIVTMVESYIAVSAGFIFLGFGGSRWTAPYVERYIGLAVTIGVKIVLLYCLISAGQSLGVGWLAEAQGVGTATHPSMTAFDVMGAALIYMMLCWQIPKLFGAVLGGSPALTGGDFAAVSAAVFGAGLEAASLAAGGVAGSAAGGSNNGAGPSGSSALKAVSAAASPNSSVPPPSAGHTGTGSNGNVPPPSPPSSRGSDLKSVGGEALAGSGFERETPAKGYTGPTSRSRGGSLSARGRGWSDAAAPPSPPRMPIDHDE